MRYDDIEQRLYKDGEKFLPYQIETLDTVAQEQPFIRHCLYYKTGAGKTKTAMAIAALKERSRATVVAPPITHRAWEAVGKMVGCEVETISHAKFRRKDYRIVKNRMLIIDEFHLLGGIKGDGFRKMERAAPHLKADLVVLSATPNYNDMERVYCIIKVLHPEEINGGLPGFLFRYCLTEYDPYSSIPKVVGFYEYEGAAHFLSSRPYVSYVPDDAEYTIQDIHLSTPMSEAFMDYNLNERRQRVMASQIEKSHAYALQQRVDPDGFLWPHVEDELGQLVGNTTTPSLIFANHEKIANAIVNTCARNNANAALLTGKVTKKQKDHILDQFLAGKIDMLIGTATLATGADGMDKMCDSLIIVHDSPDDSFRTQLVGRVLARGTSTDNSRKRISRFVFPDL